MEGVNSSRVKGVGSGVKGEAETEGNRTGKGNRKRRMNRRSTENAIPRH